jgi:arsenate reductase
MTSSVLSGKQLLPPLANTAYEFQKGFASIPAERKAILKELTDFVRVKVNEGKNVYLNFICTHNSRRSHLSQIWAQAAAHLYDVKNVQCFSGGTEATAFNPRAVKAMQEAGFEIREWSKGENSSNPVYEVQFAEEAPALRVFSKKYDDPFNHNKDFAAVMTCSHADENCPLIIGASKRIALTYDDPKEFDGSELEAAKYRERVREIGTEILFAFSQVNNR